MRCMARLPSGVSRARLMTYSRALADEEHVAGAARLVEMEGLGDKGRAKVQKNERDGHVLPNPGGSRPV